MHVSAAGEAFEEEVPATVNVPRLDEAHNAWLSPSIQRVVGEKIGAYELKFLATADVASALQQWATLQMQPDVFADATRDGAYQTTTLYLDTAAHDVFHRTPGHRGRKFRLRRYGLDGQIHLERKTRRGDRVKKRRSHVPIGELEALVARDGSPHWPGDWFRQLIHTKGMAPACRVSYDRTAFVHMTADGPLRLTLDRHIRGTACNSWDVTPVEQGETLLPEHVICEFKFRDAMPNLFKQVIQDLQLGAGSVSKYRRTMQVAGLGGAGGGPHA